MRCSLKSVFKSLAACVSIETYQRFITYSILKQAFTQLQSCQAFRVKEELWDYCSEVLVGHDKSVTFIEFGVHQGASIKYFAGKNSSSESRFIGLDSFEGLPEQWASFPKGYFSTNGVIPDVTDSRIAFIKGWFQETSATLHELIVDRDNFVVHYDADLYSSTLFALSSIDSLKKSYLAIFDEFTGHETRALYNYAQSYNASVKFLGKTLALGYPNQVLCEIKPC